MYVRPNSFIFFHSFAVDKLETVRIYQGGSFIDPCNYINDDLLSNFVTNVPQNYQLTDMGCVSLTSLNLRGCLRGTDGVSTHQK